jgi:hypothetical protein
VGIDDSVSAHLATRLMLGGASAYSAQSERGFHAIVNARCVSRAEDTDMRSSVHDGIGDRRFPVMPCSDLRPTHNVSVAGFVHPSRQASVPDTAPDLVTQTWTPA